jgi:hypothetical protein
VTRCGRVTSLESQNGPEWNGVLKDPHHPKTQLSYGKIMESVLWDSERQIHIDFLPYSVTVYAQYYSNLAGHSRRVV